VIGAIARRSALPLSLLLLVIVFGGSLWVFARNWRPSATDYPFQGIDVSESSGAIDWSAVKAGGADFGYIRATMGTDGRDARFEENWQGALAANIRRGAIHEYSLCKLAADQANNFNITVPKADDALPSVVAVDFTSDCASRPERTVVLTELGRFIAMVEAHSERPILLLVSQRFEVAYAVTGALPRPIWSSQNFFPPDYAARPWRMWRASDMRRIEGVNGPVNWDVVAK
jgi:lysozyme